MANEQRMRRNFLYGTLQSAAINVGDASISDPSFSILPAIPSTAHLALTFENVNAHTFEVMYVLSHAAGSNTITVRRAQEGTTQSTWSSPTDKWVHTPTTRDFLGVGNIAQTQFFQGTNYPAAWILTGCRDQTLAAYAGDVCEIGYNVLHGNGPITFDCFTVGGGRKITQCSSKMFYSGLSAGFENGLPGATYRDAQVSINGSYHTVSPSDFGVSGSWLYMVQPGDVVNGTVTFSWYTYGGEIGSNPTPFNTQSGDGFNQGTSGSGTAYNRIEYGTFYSKNHGPRLYAG